MLYRLLMRTFTARRLRPTHLLACSGTFLVLAGPAHAIPSPELIVGSLTGLSQLGALIAAMLGGGTALALKRRRGGPAAQTSCNTQRVTIGLAILAALLGALNLHQWSSAREARQTRLEATLTRPSRLPGQPQLDPTLKELSFAEQQRHALGLSTEAAEALIPRAAEKDTIVLDIREPAEVEMGTFTGARAIRFPDLLANADSLRGKKALLICHNGNRSSETCQALEEKGVDCRFIVGGLEKWITEGRSVGGFFRRSLREVRAIPPYPNNDRLLDTPEVRDLNGAGNVQFVDVRYPGEFRAGHLPGAINLPMRTLPTTDMKAAIAALDGRPVIVPCYDRRSCFFGELLGLELTRTARPYLGRYTVPWEYSVASPPPPHVAQFLAEEGRGWWDRAADGLANAIATLAAEIGLLAVLLALALASRLLVLPFSLKAERDQLAAATMSPEVATLKQRLAGDPERLARAMRELYARHGLTPARNQLALLMLPILALNVEAIGRVARMAPSPLALGWLDNLARPDPWLILPALFGLLLAGYLDWSLATTRRHRLVVWLLAAPLLAAAVAGLPAAAGLYLVASALLIGLQRAIVTGLVAHLIGRLVASVSLRRRGPEGLLTLAEAAAIDGVGNKAQRLGRLAAAGVPVPGGVVLTGPWLARWARADDAERRRLTRDIYRRAGSKRLAVRSSAAGEDGGAQSFAGVFESVLDVDRATLAPAIDRVLASFGAARTASYGGAGGANILVQRMVAAEFAGVLFTRAPDAVGLSLVELVAGTADKLVSGEVAPRAFRFGRVSGMPADDAAPPPIELGPLLALGRRIEALFGVPQDIEWTWRAGHFAIVQSRDITATATPDAAGDEGRATEREWCRVLGLADRRTPTAPALARSEMSEMLPRPTPLSLSLLEALHAPGGSADLACRALGLRYGVREASPELLVTVHGRLYLDAREAKRRAPRLTRLDARRLAKAADTAEADFRQAFLPGYLDEMALLAATDFDALETPMLVATARRLRDSFVTRTHVEAEIVNILAEWASGDAQRLLRTAGEDPARWLGAQGEPAFTRALRVACDVPADHRSAFLLPRIGHRAPLDYELAAPRYGEAPAALEVLIATAHHMPGPDIRPPAPDRWPSRTVEAVARARRLQTLKEDAKHFVLMELAALRRALIVIDRRFRLDGDVHFLTLEEALSLDAASRHALAATAGERRQNRETLATVPPLPAMLSLVMIERSTWAGAGVARAQSNGRLAGTRVAGTGDAEGPAFVASAAMAEQGAPLEGFRDGDILVTPMVHPAWLPEVLRAGGVVSEAGGWLSHMAIVARERNVAMIVGVAGPARIANGARIRLGANGVVERLADGPAELPHQLAAE